MHQLQSRLRIKYFFILINIFWTEYKMNSVNHWIIHLTFYRFAKCLLTKILDKIKHYFNLIKFDKNVIFWIKNVRGRIQMLIWRYEPKVCKCVCTWVEFTCAVTSHSHALREHFKSYCKRWFYSITKKVQIA